MRLKNAGGSQAAAVQLPAQLLLLPQRAGHAAFVPVGRAGGTARLEAPLVGHRAGVRAAVDVRAQRTHARQGGAAGAGRHVERVPARVPARLRQRLLLRRKHLLRALVASRKSDAAASQGAHSREAVAERGAAAQRGGAVPHHRADAGDAARLHRRGGAAAAARVRVHARADRSAAHRRRHFEKDQPRLRPRRHGALHRAAQGGGLQDRPAPDARPARRERGDGRAHVPPRAQLPGAAGGPVEDLPHADHQVHRHPKVVRAGQLRALHARGAHDSECHLQCIIFNLRACPRPRPRSCCSCW